MNRTNEQEAISLLYGEGCTRQEAASLRRLRRKYKDWGTFSIKTRPILSICNLYIGWFLTEWPSAEAEASFS